jgi:hypothetical protein
MLGEGLARTHRFGGWGWSPQCSRSRHEVKPKDVGRAGLAGWRETVANKAAGPIAARTPIDEDSVRAAIGALFFVPSLVYVVGSIKRALEA